jgi:hypothetical protein
MFKGAKPQMMRGLLLLESLADTRVLDLIHVTRTETWQVKNAEPYQPPVWTAISFEADDRQGDAIANAFSRRSRGWYISLDRDARIRGLPDRVQVHGKGDASQREAVSVCRARVSLKAIDWEE